MGSWYWIGLSVGLGAALGILFAGVIRAALIAIAVAAAAAAAAGIGIDVWQPGGIADVVGAILGAVLAAVGAAQIVHGALRRGGTRGGIAAIVAAAAVVAAAIAWVPVVGYLTALALPALAARLHRRAPERYAGLRTLARD